jgi:hypothetical protein
VGAEEQARLIQERLRNVDCWDFNIFAFRRITGGQPLFHMGLHLLQKHNLISYWKLDIMKVMKFLALIESGYHPDNCYHNCTHAADVAQALHCLLMEPKVETLILDHGRDTVPYFKGGCLMLCLTINTVCVCLAAVVQTHDSTGAAGSLHCCPLS